MEDYLVMKDITKVYDNGIMANDKVNFSARKGEIHAICGENGAGKSTLMKMLFGIEQPNEGEIIVKGEKVKLSSPIVAIQHGIGMVHQHFMLVPSLTVAENVILGIEPTIGMRFDRAKAIKMTEEVSKKYNFDINPRARVSDLAVGTKQKVEIVKALVRGCDILILDEPTAVLTPQETKELFVQLKSLRESGHTIIFISHKLNEVKQLCDRVTVIRHGHTIGVYDVDKVSEADISRYMVGVDVDLEIHKEPAKPSSDVLVVDKLTAFNEAGRKTLSDISFTVRRGEIVGIAGVEGNGQRELVNTITGFMPVTQGNVSLLGHDISKLSINQLRQYGMVHIPEDRNAMGVASNMSIGENILADKMDDPRYNNRLLTNPKNMKEDVDKWIKEFTVLCSSGEQRIGNLSGGNVQKVVVAREFTNFSELLICDQPTRGIDVGATEFIRNRMVQMRDAGKGILLVSADLGEVMSLSDTLLVMYGGQIVACFRDVKNLTEEELGYYMLGIKKMTPEQIGGAFYAQA
mgnify:CR=1 FL=1